jgi:hypothetical protein
VIDKQQIDVLNTVSAQKMAFEQSSAFRERTYFVRSSGRSDAAGPTATVTCKV